MLAWIHPEDISSPFPDVNTALHDPDGLLAAGGNLSPERLLMAYRHGIFPWYSENEPILWWSPSYRPVIFPENIHISKSMQRILKQNRFNISHNKAFKDVITACSLPRKHQTSTWITQDMINAYCRMHQLGFAHSYECWREEKLVGGVYGIQIGNIFFGESMFSIQANASKAVLIYITQLPNIKLIDCQVDSQHLKSLGAQLVKRKTFLNLIKKYT